MEREMATGAFDGDDAERQRELAIVEAERDRDTRKQEADEDKARRQKVDQFGPRNEYLWEREHILAEQECSKQSAAAWATYWEEQATYWSGRLAEHEQAFEAHMRSLGQ